MMRKLLIASVILAAACLSGAFAQQEIQARQQGEILNQAFGRLRLFLGLRKTALEDHFKSSASDVRAMSRGPMIRQAMIELDAAWRAKGPQASDLLRQQFIKENPFAPPQRAKFDGVADGLAYNLAHAALQPWSRRFLEHFGYYDLFLISTRGTVIYSAAKEDDFGRDLSSGEYAASALGYVFQRAKQSKGRKAALSDFETYLPGGGVPAAFAANAILDETGNVTGILAVRLPAEPINRILDFNEGLGPSGETYLVGSDNLMRSQSRF